MEKQGLTPVQVEQLQPGQIIVRCDRDFRFSFEKYLGMKDERTIRTQSCVPNDQRTYGHSVVGLIVSPGIYLCPENIVARLRFRDHPTFFHEIPV